MSLTIRPAAPEDAGRIAEIHVRAWRSAYRDQLPAEFLAGLSVAEREPVWRRILAGSDWPGTGTLLLSEGEDVVGFSHLGASRDADAPSTTGEVTAIYLLEEAWGRGGGRLLMGEALTRLATADYVEATLWVLDSNVRARRFYEAGGWRPDGCEKLDNRAQFVLREMRYRRRLARH